MRLHRQLFTFTLLLICFTGAVARGEDAVQQSGASNAGNRPARVIIYPLLVQTPLFGAEINLPSIPGAPPGGGGGESGEVDGSTDVSLNTAYLAGFLVQTNRLFVEASGTWADISAERQLPHVLVKTNTLAFIARGGVRLFDGISATAGVHHLSTDLDATLDLPNLGRLEGSTKPGYWDPMLGVDWRHTLGRWEFQANFEGGGFGVGTDVDLSSEARVDYRIGYFDMRFGFAVSHIEATILDVSIGQFQRTMVTKQTLYGPNIGFGIAFGK